MSSASGDGAERLPDAPILGELLVQRGLLSEDQLEHSLEEQQRTGRRLGDIVVELGYVPATKVAQALATQHGGLLKSEYGIAFGFDTGGTTTGTLVDEPPMTLDPGPGTPHQTPPACAVEEVIALLNSTGGSVVPPSTPHEEPVNRGHDPAEPEAVVEQLQLLAADLASAVSARDRALAEVVDLRQRLEAAVSALASVRAAMGKQEAAHDAAEVAAAEFAVQQAAELASITQERDRLATRIHEVDSARNAAVALAEGTTTDRDLAVARTDALAARLDELEQENAQLLAKVQSMSERVIGPGPDPKQTGHPMQASAHLAFVATCSGYLLLERPGPPPAAGDTVLLTGDTGIEALQLVVRVGAPPLPGTSLPCAYLIPVG